MVVPADATVPLAVEAPSTLLATFTPVTVALGVPVVVVAPAVMTPGAVPGVPS